MVGRLDFLLKLSLFWTHSFIFGRVFLNWKCRLSQDWLRGLSLWTAWDLTSASPVENSRLWISNNKRIVINKLVGVMSVTLMGGCRPSNQRDDLFTWAFLIFLLGMLPLGHIFAVWPSFAPKSSSNEKKGHKKSVILCSQNPPPTKKGGNRCHHLMALPQFFLTKNTLTGQK